MPEDDAVSAVRTVRVWPCWRCLSGSHLTLLSQYPGVTQLRGDARPLTRRRSAANSAPKTKSAASAGNSDER